MFPFINNQDTNNIFPIKQSKKSPIDRSTFASIHQVAYDTMEHLFKKEWRLPNPYPGACSPPGYHNTRLKINTAVTAEKSATNRFI